MNHRGEGLTIILGVTVAAFILGTFIPQINPANWFKTNPNTYTANWDKATKTSTPKIAVFENGNVAVFQETKESYDRGSEKTVPKLTLMQSVGNWISNLSFFWFIVIALGLAFGIITPTGLAMHARNVWKSAFKNQVASIRSIDDEDTYKKVTKVIQTRQDALGPKAKRQAEKLVDKIKAELH